MRVRAYCACSRCWWVLTFFLSRLSFLSSLYPRQPTDQILVWNKWERLLVFSTLGILRYISYSDAILCTVYNVWYFGSTVFIKQSSTVSGAVLFPTRCPGWDRELNWVSFWGFSYLLWKACRYCIFEASHEQTSLNRLFYFQFSSVYLAPKDLTFQNSLWCWWETIDPKITVNFFHIFIQIVNFIWDKKRITEFHSKCGKQPISANSRIIIYHYPSIFKIFQIKVNIWRSVFWLFPCVVN